MKISNSPIVIVNYILSGAYSQTITGKIGRLYAFSSPSNPISNFSAPYDAILPNKAITGAFNQAVGDRIKAACPVTSDRTGALYYYNSANLYGTCHGYGHTNLTYYSGYNYYNAFYPAGYFSPPFGENISIFKSDLIDYDALRNGGCSNLTVTEYNEEFGIISKTSADAELTSSTLVSNIYAPIYSPKEVCPAEVTIASYYDEFQLTNIAGNSTNIGGNDYHNGNPIPTSLDSFDIKINGRYSILKVGDVSYVQFTGSRPISSYTITNQENKLNNSVCFASLMESQVSLGRGTNATQLVEAPDALKGAIGDQVSFAGADPFHYWNWTFKENAATLPFMNNFVTTETDSTLPFRRRSVSEGTPLFLPILSSEEYYWENRQCPATVDFLPWTFGASIYACPSEHFDIPYYAAMKKFGFYGTRFLNTCKALNLSNSLSGVDNASEMPTGAENYQLGEGEIEPTLDLDKDGKWSPSIYSNLLRTAQAEEQYSNMYALNNGFFIWANKPNVTGDIDFMTLTGKYPAFPYVFQAFVKKFDDIYTSGLNSFTGSEPVINLQQLDEETFSIISTGTNLSNILLDNSEYLKFKDNLKQVISGDALWSSLENKYAYYIANGTGESLNEDFYRIVISGREKRFRTRYLENMIRGNPIDLFPMNNITFAFDQAKDYIEHSGWGRKLTPFGKTSPLPEVNRRYFEGAYGRGSAVSGLVELLNRFSSEQVTYYYPGFFNDVRLNKTLPKGSYNPVITGLILDTSGRKYSPSGWLALGYNEIGKLDSNFSCFTPLFVQQPVPKVFCKIGQKPTFRALAVDYHTIPEDKISRKYPEIIFWAEKLKLLDCNKSYLYPIKYRWFRTPKGQYNAFISSGNFSKAEFSSATGSWCCLEGDGPDCTMIHPTNCVPTYTGTAKSESHYTFLKGAINRLDDQYYYSCLVSGRFGVRISNPSELNIENWLRFDVSVKNGMNIEARPRIDFEMNDASGIDRVISLSPDEDAVLTNYAGYQQDGFAQAESVIEQKIPPPNAGWGDVTAYRFIGPVGYVGTTRSYGPSALRDTHGLREIWGHMLEYGNLIPFSKILSQKEGDWLYGHSHLPVCDNYSMGNGKKGVKVVPYLNGYKMQHWTLNQKAIASLDNIRGIQWDRLNQVGELFPPINSRFDSPVLAIGHWQWGNNLGSIKRFGKFSTSDDIGFVGGAAGIREGTQFNQMIDKVKTKLVLPNDLAGENCGFTPYGLGRNMVYYLEAYDRYYLICDAAKKKNVTNRSYISPGTRINNSAIQYFWLGKPTNVYLRRRPMYGPYAYQWQVKRHNRDRNGNGISEGFYSMGHTRRYSLLYDAPAIYGLYPKHKNSSNYKTLVTAMRDDRDALNITQGYVLNSANVRYVWFGEERNEGSARRYGSMVYSCDPTSLAYNARICQYVSSAQSLATNIDFGDHYCPESLAARGECFDPCMSMRYSHGFVPGGKKLDLLGNNGDFSPNSNNPNNIKLVPLAKIKNGSPQFTDEVSATDSTVSFRSPINTPHSRISQGLKSVGGQLLEGTAKQFVGGVSPCQDGGSDHCNYLTATLHLDSSSFMEGFADGLSEFKNFIANVYNSPSNILGDVS